MLSTIVAIYTLYVLINIYTSVMQIGFINQAKKAEAEAAKAAEPESEYLTKGELEKKIREKRKLMEEAAKALDFLVAAKLRDEIKVSQDKLEKLKN